MSAIWTALLSERAPSGKESRGSGPGRAVSHCCRRRGEVVAQGACGGQTRGLETTRRRGIREREVEVYKHFADEAKKKPADAAAAWDSNGDWKAVDKDSDLSCGADRSPPRVV